VGGLRTAGSLILPGRSGKATRIENKRMVLTKIVKNDVRHVFGTCVPCYDEDIRTNLCSGMRQALEELAWLSTTRPVEGV